MSKVLIGYHADCIDGFTSVWVARRAMLERGNEVETIEMEYNQDSILRLEAAIECILPDTCYLVDYSVSKNEYIALINAYPRVGFITLDHHKTAFERYGDSDREITTTSTLHWVGPNNSQVILDNDRSGAGLCWSLFYPTKDAPMLVKYVQDYDLWRFKLGDNTKYMHQFLGALDYSFESWGEIYTQLEKGDLSSVRKGKELQDCHDGDVVQVAAKAVPIILAGYTGLVVQCDRVLASDVGHALSEKCGTFGACIRLNLEAGKIEWSLRGTKDFDVSAIAKRFGGGGHAGAAGFESSLTPKQES